MGADLEVRVLVTGSQLWTDKKLIQFVPDKLLIICLREKRILVLVHGACPNGADRFANEWGVLRKSEGLPVVIEPHAADWKGPRKRGAGYARNAEMVALGADICLAFILDESNGSSHCSGLAEKAKIDIHYFRRKSMGDIVTRRKWVRDEITIYDAQIMWRNFAGKEKAFNAAGQRNFAVRLDEVLYEQLKEIGWSVKFKEPRKGYEDDPLFFLPVGVKWKEGLTPPRIFLVTESTNSRNRLNEDTAWMMDHGIFDRVDVTLRPYNWTFNGREGVAAYLRSIYATLHEDPLDQKYIDYRDAEETLALENFLDEEITDDTDWVNDESRLAFPRGER